MEGFEYVVNPPPVSKIAFGSTLHREALPLTGPNVSSFMRSIMGEVREFPGPLDYDTFKPLGFKYASNAGFSAFANKMARLPAMRDPEYPPLGSYEADNWKRTDKNGWTIGVADSREKEPKWLTPGAPTYPFHNSYPNLKLTTCFGSKRIIWPAVAVFCSNYNTSRCMKCDRCPFGDYFHNFNTNQDMCRLCMHKQMEIIKNCDLQVVERYRMRREMQQFVPARYCGFFHAHEGTAAHVELTTRKELRDKIRTENYLYRFHAKSNT